MASRGSRSGRTANLLDLLVLRFPSYDRDTLYRSVMCSEVLVDDTIVYDPSAAVRRDARIEIVRKRYVSRGGEKLAAALEAWMIPVAGKVWLDAGASTGGFTDALLQHGALRVHAVDVGYNQLDYRLRSDPRVIVRERENIQKITALDPVPAAAVCDLSFRSLRGVLAHILSLTAEGWGVALLKPQFEAAAEMRWGRRESVGLDDGVLDPGFREEVIDGTIRDLAEEGIRVERRMDSTVPGRKGNLELLALVRLDR